MSAVVVFPAPPQIDIEQLSPRAQREARRIQRWQTDSIVLLARLGLVEDIGTVRAVAQRALQAVAEADQ